ncbi:Gustatory receptor 25 [Cephus cinctus]|uniref:Gustatory receptor n=1 Tax=Cephus cinctus TaxID=211228 RepID=A0A3L9M0P4_CEPCN|nr:gustatory and odorant receptor 24 [Cephus cinctus]RLZ02143.1 Gustatory receptor 25 [Cephus cinctus]
MVLERLSRTMSAFRTSRVAPKYGMNDFIGGMQPRIMYIDQMNNKEKISHPMRIPIEAFKKHDKGELDVVYDNIKPVVTVIRIMGALPITRTRSGITRFKLASNAMIYSAVVYFALTAHVLYVAWNRIRIVGAVEGRFEESVIAYLFIVYLMPNFLIPLLWYETPKHAECFNHWKEFQIFYKRITTRDLPINLKRRALWTAILVPILSAAAMIGTHLTMINFSIWQIIPYVYVTAFINISGAYWYIHCAAISRSANVLAQDFKHALRNNVQATTVAEYRALWLHLNRITRKIGVMCCYSFTILTIYLFFSLTLSIYGLFSQLQDGLTIKDAGLTLSACSNIILLHFICDQAHAASQHVRVHFQKKLLLVEISDLNPDAQTEIDMFLRATEMNPSDMSLGGFFDVNRNLFKSFLGTMVTYLVVLLQFQISLPESKNNDNATMDNI